MQILLHGEEKYYVSTKLNKIQEVQASYLSGSIRTPL